MSDTALDPTDANFWKWPLENARSTGIDATGLLAALYATTDLDELSNIEDWESLRRAIRFRGKVDSSGLTTTGVALWVYPTGLHGPYHVTENGETKLHGVLLTVEKGVLVEDAVDRAKASLKDGVICHEHVAKGSDS